MTIPKTIHYCWFGHGEKPTVFQKCLESWKRFFPDFEIMEWNEDNIDLSFSVFAQAALAEKKYAFVSDVVRLKVIYDYGGIYLDTDVEIRNSFSSYLSCDAFFFFQNHNQINTGQGFGAVKNHWLIKAMLESYQLIEFNPEKMLELACPKLNTEVIQSLVDGFINSDETQFINGCAFVAGEEYWKIAHHYGEFSWKSESQRAALRYAKKRHGAWKLKKIVRNPKIFLFLDNHSLYIISKIYGFRSMILLITDVYIG